MRAHRAAVGDGHGVEGEVELVGQVEGHTIGPLGFHDALVLPEDRALERLQHVVRLLQVVVARDQAVTSCTVCGATTALSGSPSRPAWTNAKWPKSVKFSTCREASHAQANGPARTVRQPSASSSGTSAIGQRGGSSATHTMP
jgi:hypothetical protein